MNKHLRNILIAGTVTVGTMAVTNKLIDVTSARKDTLPIGNGIFYKWKYGNIYYTKTGHGRPLLLVHDLCPSSSSYEWNRVIMKLSHTHTVYALDLPGCGRSDKPNLTYTNYMFVQLINDFVRNVIGSKADVAATGDSFSFIIMACNMEPKNFNKIIGVSPCSLSKMKRTPDKRKNVLKYVLDSPVIGTYLYNLDTSRVRISKTATKRYYYKNYMISDTVIDACYKAAKNQEGRGKYLLASIQSCYTNINIIPAIEKINNSICLVGGRMNPIITDIIDEYKTYNPSIEDAYIAGTNYLPQLETPNKFVELLNILL